MGQLHEMETLLKYAEARKMKFNTVQRKLKQKFRATFGKETILSAEHLEFLSSGKTPSGPRKQKSAKPRNRFGTDVEKFRQEFPADEADLKALDGLAEKPAATQIKRNWLLYGLLCAATLASVQNMYRVTSELSEANMSALLLTAVLSVSAIVFVIVGVRRWYTGALAALLIAYEGMCNMTRIHAGLYGVSGNPTRFLSQFCDTFNAGTHQSAFFLALFTAFFIAAVQYAAVFELNKSN